MLHALWVHGPTRDKGRIGNSMKHDILSEFIFIIFFFRIILLKVVRNSAFLHESERVVTYAVNPGNKFMKL